MARGWSQAQLAERSGLSVRTIQRVENGTNPGLESLRNLAAALGVDIAELQEADADGHRPSRSAFVDAVVHALRHFDDFTGTAGRPEFWWSALAATLVLAIAGAIGPQAQAVVTIVLLLPMTSLGVRRLRDAGDNPWWILLMLVPVGGIVGLVFLWAKPSVPAVAEQAEPSHL